MKQIGLGPALLIAAAVAVGVFDIPVVWVSAVCAILMCLAAYAASRELSTLRLALGMFVLASAKLLIAIIAAQGGGTLPEWLQTWSAAMSSDELVIGVSALVFVLAMVLGIFGPLRHLKSVDELLKEHERR